MTYVDRSGFWPVVYLRKTTDTSPVLTSRLPPKVAHKVARYYHRHEHTQLKLDRDIAPPLVKVDEKNHRDNYVEGYREKETRFAEPGATLSRDSMERDKIEHDCYTHQIEALEELDRMFTTEDSNLF